MEVFYFFFIFLIKPGTESSLTLPGILNRGQEQLQRGSIPHSKHTGGDWLCGPHCYSPYAGSLTEGGSYKGQWNLSWSDMCHPQAKTHKHMVYLRLSCLCHSTWWSSRYRLLNQPRWASIRHRARLEMAHRRYRAWIKSKPFQGSQVQGSFVTTA